MKNFIKNILLITAIILIANACNTGKQLYEKGDYYQAVIKSVEKLRKNPNNKKAMETLSNAYPNAVNTLLDELENEGQLQSEFRNTKAVHVYEKLNTLYENIVRAPAAKKVISQPNKYYTHLDGLKPKAAEEQYRAGLKHLSYRDRENAKLAYFYFLEAEKFVSNYKDVSAKIDEAFFLSILYVQTNFKPIHSRMYKLSANFFYAEVTKILKQIEQQEFVRFYTSKELQERNIKNPEQLLEINFEDFVVGETHTLERIEEMVSDTLKIGEVTLEDGTKKEVLGTVNAKVNISRMEVISRGLVNLSIRQKNESQYLINENFHGEYVWYNEWGNYNGDKRALTREQLNICNQRSIYPPEPQQMFIAFTHPIYEQLRRELFYFYDNY